MRVIYYVIFDLQKYLGEQILRIFKLTEINYRETSDTWLEAINLPLTLWEGEFENFNGIWLRWCDENDNLLLTGDESVQKAILKQKSRKRITRIKRKIASTKYKS
ncbi:hypothetical protein GM3708_2549 [Geminocystis sp. NIES-3708]|uniref:hypothetical protein n=1 Tax=Geminocystis sp. NIES-3708 TaxID=1615909 RepID=UPI0005FC4130|nr:hypothetical protein [Geminocystis sp. NIES-3708]BAQ62143.1 hypothetical protein GM3708_2549 [Geminocystis sp. NIES-3708]